MTCRFVIIPDMLKNAPMFKRIDPKYRVSDLPCHVLFLRHAVSYRSMQMNTVL